MISAKRSAEQLPRGANVVQAYTHPTPIHAVGVCKRVKDKEDTSKIHGHVHMYGVV